MADRPWMTRRSCFLLAALTLASACRTTTEPREHADLDRLVGFMIGSFDSSAQAAIDPDYRDIHLHMARVFQERTDGCWLYVEQAVATAPEKPYRQRVYRVHEEAGGFVSDVYTLPGDPLRFTGTWRDPSLFQGVTVESLSLKDGCSIHLHVRPDGSFAGSTDGSMCPSELRGAKFATSKVEITQALLSSWDQGFDASGKQVWGAEKGPYQFVKQP